MVAAEHPEPDGVTDADLADVADADGRAAPGRHHDVANVVEAVDEADAAHDQRVLPVTDVAAAGVGVVGADRVEDLLEGEVVGAQPRRVEGDLVLLDAAAPGDDVHDARNAAELALEHPVLERLQLDERHRAGLERIAIDLADDARQRP